MTRLNSILLILLLTALALAGCAEEQPMPETTETQPASFEVTPHVSVTGTDFRSDVRVDHVFLGIGQVSLEPLDDLSAPIISNRTAAKVEYDHDDLSMDNDTLLPGLEVPAEGRYLVTLSVEPQTPAEEPQIDQMARMVSIQLVGTYFRRTNKMGDCNPFTDPDCSPEPVPWFPGDGMYNSSFAADMAERGSSTEAVPFSYTSERTGYIRLGEVYLSPEFDQLHINVNLEGWLDEALRPVLAEVSSTSADGQQAPSLDVSGRLEGYGLGLEKLFMLSEAFAL